MNRDNIGRQGEFYFPEVGFRLWPGLFWRNFHGSKAYAFGFSFFRMLLQLKNFDAGVSFRQWNCSFLSGMAAEYFAFPKTPQIFPSSFLSSRSHHCTHSICTKGVLELLSLWKFSQNPRVCEVGVLLHVSERAICQLEHPWNFLSTLRTPLHHRPVLPPTGRCPPTGFGEYWYGDTSTFMGLGKADGSRPARGLRSDGQLGAWGPMEAELLRPGGGQVELVTASSLGPLSRHPCGRRLKASEWPYIDK